MTTFLKVVYINLVFKNETGVFSNFRLPICGLPKILMIQTIHIVSDCAAGTVPLSYSTCHVILNEVYC